VAAARAGTRRNGKAAPAVSSERRVRVMIGTPDIILTDIRFASHRHASHAGSTHVF
jgi:hypothetical protein